MAYLPLSTANLPDPAINPAQGSNPEDYFNTVLYTGNGGTNRSITGMNFQADFLWHKDRSASRNHSLVDVIRGTNDLQSNANAAERSMPSFVSFDSDGFTVTQDGSTNPNWNENSITKVVWGWKANGSGSTIAAGSIDGTNPTIASQVSANTESGFSIVTFTGTGSNETVGHGLSSAPDCILFLRRDTSGSDHKVYHSALGATQNLRLNNTDAARTQSDFFNDTEPTTSVFSIGGARFASSSTNVSYCFHSVEGFSKCSNYLGNGSADGSFIYTGFRPSFLIIKATGLNEGWIMYDTKRNSYNLSSTVITAEEASGDATNAVYGIDILSNGFKCRYNWNGVNGSGQNYIYMAFAENPFKFSLAR